jgi:hypothetical protein
MTKEPSQEQIKEFWKYFKVKPKEETRYRLVWESYDPDDTRPPRQVEDGMDTVYPDINLQNMFDYAVPKVIKSYQRAWSDGKPLRVSVEIAICWCSPTVHRKAYWSSNFSRPSLLEQGHTEVLNYAEANTPSLALFWSIWGVIHAD